MSALPDSAPSDRHPSPERLGVLTQALLVIDDAHREGLIDGVPWIDRARCRRLLMKLEGQGVRPDEDEVASCALELMVELGVLRG